MEIKEKFNSFVPYLATLYYVEIIYLMVFINFLYGKFIAVTAGLSLTFLLTIHILRLFNKKDISRRIQLYFMDLHFAYSFAYFFNRIFSRSDLTAVDLVLIVFRLLTAFVEIAAVLILTDRIVRSGYTD